MPTRSIIYWECQSPEHQALRSRHGIGGLTIHDGAWAYCDGAGSNDAHRWTATGGMPLEDLVRWTAPSDATVDAGAPMNGDYEENARKVTGISRT